MLLLGVKKITDKCFKEFTHTHFLEPAVSPAYKVDQFIIQNFCNRGPKSARRCVHKFGPIDADISFFYESENFSASSVPDLIKDIKKLLKVKIKSIRPQQNDKRNIKCHYIYYSSPRFEDKAPLLFVDKAAAYYLFISSKRDKVISQIYDEISSLYNLSEKYQGI